MEKYDPERIIKHDEILDAIRIPKIDIERLRQEHPDLSLRREEILGYKFKVGEEVEDEEDGAIGTVIAVERFRIPKE